MTKEDFKKRMKEIDEAAERQKRLLQKSYAIENNPYIVGQIIKDHIGKGRIKSMEVYYNEFIYPYQMMMYKCDNLTHVETINKKEPTRYIYQFNIVE